jgi:hypothetical protein
MCWAQLTNMRFTLTFLAILVNYSVFAQKPGDAFIGITSDTAVHSHYLRFLSDSTLEISEVPRHFSIYVRDTVNYVKEQNKVKVLSKYFFFMREEINLDVEGRALVENELKIVYVRLTDFSKDFDFLYVIDGSRYIQKTGIPNSYGVIAKKYKKNKKLYARIDELAPTEETYSIELLKGYAAFKKYGYRYTYGVIELNRR